MRFWFAMTLLLALAVGLALFPEVASQMMTIEVLGWHLEMKQGVFLALLLFLLLLFRMILWLFRLVIKGPRQLMVAWRNGGRARQEKRVRTALTAWANGESMAANAFAVDDTVLPRWLADALAALTDPEHAVKADEPPLQVALRGRALSEADAPLVERKEAVDRWLQLFPRSPRARQQALQLAEAMEAWPTVVALIDQAPRGVTIADASARKARALLRWAQLEPARALERLRQAAKLVDDDDIVIALAAVHRDGDDLKSARTVLLDGLDRRDSLPIARALAAQEAALDNPLLTLHMLDKRCRKGASVAQCWLLVELSRQAEDRERMRHHLRMLKQMPAGNALAWEIEAQLHMDDGDWESAARCYQQACSETKAG